MKLLRKLFLLIVTTFLIAVLSNSAFAQDSLKFAIGRPTDTAVTKGSLKAYGVLRLPHYGTSDSSLFFGIDANGFLTLRHLPAAGGGVTLIQMNDSLAKKVSYSDSIIKYVTPTQLRDSFRTIYDTFNNSIANNFIPSVLVVTANATPIQLDKGSPQWIAVKGSLNQQIHLPDVTTFQKKGYTYYFDNISAGSVTVTPFGSSFGIITVPPLAFGWAVCIDTTVNVGTSWNIVYVPKFLGGPSANTGVIRDNVGDFTINTQTPTDSSKFPASTAFVKVAVKNVAVDTTGLVQKADSNQSNSGGWLSYNYWLTHPGFTPNLYSILHAGDSSDRGVYFSSNLPNLNTSNLFYCNAYVGLNPLDGFTTGRVNVRDTVNRITGFYYNAINGVVNGIAQIHVVSGASNLAFGFCPSVSLQARWDINFAQIQITGWNPNDYMHMDSGRIYWNDVGNLLTLGHLTLTSARNINFPDKSGTIAMTSDIPAQGVTSVTAGAGLSGGAITSTGTISMPNVGTPGTYGSATVVPVITTDAQGRSSITTATCAPPFSAVTGTIATSQMPTTITGASCTSCNITFDNWGRITVAANGSGGGMTNPMTTTNDMIYSSPGSTPVRLAAGTNNQRLGNSSGVPAWQNDIGTINVALDGQGSVISNTAQAFFTVPYGCTITNWYVTCDVSGSITFDVKRSGSSIVGAGNKPLVSSASSGNAAVSGWTSTAIAANDVFNVVISGSPSTVTKATMLITCNKN